MNQFIKDKIRVSCDNLAKLSEKVIYQVPELWYIPWDYKKPMEKPMPDVSWEKLPRNSRVCGRDRHFWFYTEITVPEVQKGWEPVLELITSNEGTWDGLNPQGLIYLNGVITQGLDINHRQVALEAGKEYKILLYFYTGMIDRHMDVMMDIKAVDLTAKKLYYDIKVPYDAAMCFEEDDYTHIRTIKALEQACNRIDFRKPESTAYYESLACAEKYLTEEYYQKECGQSTTVMNYIGHTHIDVAWLWSLDQTKEKTQRTFSTVLRLMDKYPEYVFMSSQPQLYEYLKQEEPELYERVKEKIKEGRWEAEGAMWLEADCNLSSGESLIRQVLFGKRFMKEEFDVDSHILWLPDVFGYSAALPQILQKSGVDTFVTSKISWNETNKLPNDVFMWEGLDGTEIFSYFLPAQNHSDYLENKTFTTYVGTVTPQMNLGTWERFQQKEYFNEAIVTFGYGDGGGGPTEEMLETQRRLAYGIPGMPKAQMSFAGDFLARLKTQFDENCMVTGRRPKWVGELYLEFHRGTYTSIAKNKKNNRECEFLLQETETLSVLDKLLNRSVYPKEELNRNWKTVLLNQFHDIIPGSSIHEVYEESDRQYARTKEEIGKIRNDKLSALAGTVAEEGVLIYNPNSFTASGYVHYGDERVYAQDVPALGYKVIPKKEVLPSETTPYPVIVSGKVIESPHYKIVFDEDMNIASLYDKDATRQVLKTGEAGNKLRVFEDYPREYDNWEISSYYKQKMWEINDVESVEVLQGASYGGYRIVRKYMDSVITQNILVYEKSRRIDFETEINWQEDHVLLKTAFPIDVHTAKATYEVQFGHVERPTHANTGWDEAKFEVCAQKWGDLSEEGYGVSLINNCKYGYSTEGSEMSLTLIKCGTYPDPMADKGYHSFTYSLYPHMGSFKQGGTISQAYLLNRPLQARKAEGKGNLPPLYSLVSCDKENVVIETVKEAEDTPAVVIRLYEAWDKRSEVTLKFGFEAKKISLCDLMERPLAEIGTGNEITLNVANFEIVTLIAEL